jgi:tetratricopeptide (TPR) repeat protein
LVEVADGSQLWGQQYNRKLSDIFTIQEEIAREISERLRLRLSVKEKGVVRRATENIEAFQLYLKGRYFWNKRPAGLSKGIEYFRAAIEKDPTYALAYAGLADSYSALGSWESGLMPPQDAMPKARAAVMKALEIDETLAEAHTSLAYCKMHYDWDWVGSEIQLKQAVELNHNYATAHHWYSHRLMYMGRVEESLIESRRCLELDPLDLILNIHLGWHYYFARQFDKAIDQQRKTIDMESQSVWPHFELGRAYEQEGMYKEAIIEFKKAEELSPTSTFVKAGLAHVFAISGEDEAAHTILEDLKSLSNEQFVPSYDIAVIYVGLRQKEQAFEWLEKAKKERSGWMAYLKIEPRLDYLRSDTRFHDILSRVGLRSD